MISNSPNRLFNVESCIPTATLTRMYTLYFSSWKTGSNHWRLYSTLWIRSTGMSLFCQGLKLESLPWTLATRSIMPWNSHWILSKVKQNLSNPPIWPVNSNYLNVKHLSASHFPISLQVCCGCEETGMSLFMMDPVKLQSCAVISALRLSVSRWRI